MRDASALSVLLGQLGYPATTQECETKISGYQEDGYALLMGEVNEIVIGFIALHWYSAFHHTKPIGRIVAFCIAEKMRGTGLGTIMLNYAENFFKEKDCLKVELTSNLRRKESHEYYFRRGYQQTSMHFIKFLKK